MGERFELLGEIGRGGMATVHLARDREANADVALKVLHGHLADRPAMRRRLAREVEATRRIRHPAVLLADGPHELGDTLALSMPLARDGTLLERVEADGPLDEAGLRRVLAAVGGALVEAHRAGILHRDVTPGNVLLDGDRVLLADFGLARIADGTTASTTALGTPGYAAPETWDGATDPRSDAFGLGAVLYFAATGHAPYEAATAVGSLERQRRGDLDPLAARRPDLPADLVRAIEGLLRPVVEERAALADALEARVVAPAPSRRGGWQWTQVGSAASLVLLVLLGWFQDLGAFLLATMVQGHAVPDAGIFEMTQGVSALLLLPLALLPALAGALAGRRDAHRRVAPWAGIAALASLNLLYALAAGVVLPAMGMRSDMDMVGTMMFHLAAFVPLALVTLAAVRPWKALRGEAVAEAPADLATQARTALEQLRSALGGAGVPEVVRTDLGATVRALLADVDELSAVLAERLEARPPELERLQARLARARTLGSAEVDELARAVAAEEAACEAEEEAVARRTRATARLLEIRATASVARARLRGPEARPVTEALQKLRRGAQSAAAARSELERLG